MGIFRALGLGVAIVILKLLLPEIMGPLVGTLSALFTLTETILANVQSAVE